MFWFNKNEQKKYHQLFFLILAPPIIISWIRAWLIIDIKLRVRITYDLKKNRMHNTHEIHYLRFTL